MLPLIVGLFALLSCAQSINVHLVAHTHDDVGWQVTVDQYYIGNVQYIITTVIEQLLANPERKFIYVEQAFFQRWWRQQPDDVRSQVKYLVDNKQLEFINGGWSMHDEASTHFIDMIDQTTYGHRFIKEQFGVTPKIGWQIDPFGHSATQAALLSAEVGFDALFFGRMDYQDYNARAQTKDLEWIWRASESMTSSADVFAGKFWNGYGPPSGFNFDIGSNDAPIIDDPLLEGYNVDQRVDDFVKAAMDQSKLFQGENLMWTMGSDFQYSAAHFWFDNLDKLIKAVNLDGRVTCQYSTPSIYLAAKNAENLTFSLKTDDIFPYADNANSYWTGYFTSRPSLKRYVRVQSQFLQVARHLEALVNGDGNKTEALWEALGVAQHHDGVSGTAKQDVTYDYAKRLSVGGASSEDIINSGIASLLTQPGADLPSFSYCPLANTSICDVSSTKANLIVSVYNSLARERTELVRIPIAFKDATVYDNNGKAMKSEVLPNPSINPSITSDSLPYEVRFNVVVPAMGLNTAFVITSSQEDTEQSINQTIDEEFDAVIVDKVQPPQSIKNEHRHRRSLKSVKNSVVAPQATYIQNDFWRLDFDDNGLLSKVTNMTSGDVQPISQNFFWYPSYQVSGQQNSGAYIFRPNVTDTMGFPVSNSASINIVQGPITAEVQQTFASWLTQRVRLTVGSPTIEFEYTVGPIPFEDGQGKEIVTRFSSSIQSNGTWYTDSNGREWQQRIRNFRPTWKWNPTQPIAGNYYPCNVGMWLADQTNAMSILNDRSQGCTSLVDGQLEYMVHRRTLMDDGRGVGQPINETGLSGNGLITTGIHYLSLAPTSEIAAVTRPLQSRVYSYLHQAYAPLTTTVSKWLSNHNTQFTAINTPLPQNVELVSFYKSSQDEVVLRLAHNYGINEHAIWSQPATIDLAQLFVAQLVPTTITEVSLTNNQSPQDIINGKMKWNIRGDQSDNEKIDRYVIDGTSITLQPAQIRTFVFTY